MSKQNPISRSKSDRINQNNNPKAPETTNQLHNTTTPAQDLSKRIIAMAANTPANRIITKKDPRS
jgi:hypothetical protein